MLPSTPSSYHDYIRTNGLFEGFTVDDARPSSLFFCSAPCQYRTEKHLSCGFACRRICSSRCQKRRKLGETTALHIKHTHPIRLCTYQDSRV
ncbi:hypothetical protein Hsc_1483 [Herbaspirillum seropedicae]|nr:hypothetical protein Hsc_1483 [Herbaspirillum seropedicae]